MALSEPKFVAQSRLDSSSKKRKDPPGQSKPQDGSNKKPKHNAHANRVQTVRDARTISAQVSSKALRNGELDVEKFVKAREYEIQALEKGLRESKQVLTKRAFQQVPKDMRRRTASHNVKRVPKKLRGQANREMVEDNTPPLKKKASRHMRLRVDTVKRLRALGEKRKAEKGILKEEKRRSYGNVTVQGDIRQLQELEPVGSEPTIKTRAPKVKKATLAKPPIPKAKFRKRQVHKSWLPTHLFHAKRARMTEPSRPLWRFAIPLTPSQKGYRSTHRATNYNGAVMWDMSYTSTMSLQGRQDALMSMLRQIGVGNEFLYGREGDLWRDGKRSWKGWVHERDKPTTTIAPVTLIWSPVSNQTESGERPKHEHGQAHMFLRVHPSAFLQTWEEMVRLSKTVKPAVRVEDLRFELGSIEIAGPGSTEALLGALRPYTGNTQEVSHDSTRFTQSNIFNSLNPLASPSALPQNAILAFTVQDPRLHHPTSTVSTPADAEQSLLKTISSWPTDTQPSQPLAVFSRRHRLASQAALSSQKSINRRRTLAAPGEHPSPRLSDPQIPVLLFTSRPSTFSKSHTSTWTLLAPWKCIQSIWYSLKYYPLSTGGQPRFGGLIEQQQLCFEASEPWFPGDFPGTKAGWEWELRERRKRWEAWMKRPKGKRVSWNKVNLGDEGRGEIGEGWACDWNRLLDDTPSEATSPSEKADVAESPDSLVTLKPVSLCQITSAQARAFLCSSNQPLETLGLSYGLIAVRLNLVSRGTPRTCARIYRLPSRSANTSLRSQWLAMHPAQRKKQPTKHALPQASVKGLPSHVAAQRRLARSLLQPPQAGDETYPACPNERDLIGFVTSGGFNLALGSGTAVGSLLLARVLDEAKADDGKGRLCIIRNAGENVGRLATWEIS